MSSTPAEKVHARLPKYNYWAVSLIIDLIQIAELEDQPALKFAQDLIVDVRKNRVSAGDKRVAMFAKHHGICAEDTLAALRNGARFITKARLQVQQVQRISTTCQ